MPYVNPKLVQQDKLYRIYHGRYDIICPVVQAWDLHKAWPEADLHIIPDAGHSIYEEGIKNKLLEYTDKFSKL